MGCAIFMKIELLCGMSFLGRSLSTVGGFIGIFSKTYIFSPLKVATYVCKETYQAKRFFCATIKLRFQHSAHSVLPRFISFQ